MMRARQHRWLRHYRETASKTEACIRSAVPYRTVARWKYGDAAFKGELERAEETVAHALEDRAVLRAMKTYDEDRSSADLLKFMLKAYRPDRFADRMQHDVGGTVHVKRIMVEGGDASRVVEATYVDPTEVASDNEHSVTQPLKGLEGTDNEGTATQAGAPGAQTERE